MRILLSGYGTGSQNGDQARQYKTLRIDGGDASKSARIVQGGVVPGSRRQISLNISGTTRKVGDSLDNDVEILLYDLNQAEIAALIGKPHRVVRRPVRRTAWRQVWPLRSGASQAEQGHDEESLR